MVAPPWSQRAHSWARGLRAAFVFLTRLPVGGHPYESSELSWAPAHFPLVGATIGAISGLSALLAPMNAPLLGAILVVGTSVLLTGAFHEDGLADSADALGGTHSKERLLEIMKDSRVGTYGACTLAVTLMFRVACIAQLLPRAWAYLACAHCLARLSPVWLMKTLPYVREAATSKQPVTGTGWPQVAFATCATLGVLTLLAATQGAPLHRAVLPALLAVSLFTWGAARYLLSRVGGTTGDVLGAVEQLCECLILFVFVWHQP